MFLRMFRARCSSEYEVGQLFRTGGSNDPTHPFTSLCFCECLEPDVLANMKLDNCLEPAVLMIPCVDAVHESRRLYQPAVHESSAGYLVVDAEWCRWSRWTRVVGRWWSLVVGRCAHRCWMVDGAGGWWSVDGGRPVGGWCSVCRCMVVLRSVDGG